MKKLSFVIPVYNSEKTVGEVVRRIRAMLAALDTPYDYEIILVNDGSRDGSFAVCRALAQEDRAY